MHGEYYIIVKPQQGNYPCDPLVHSVGISFMLLVPHSKTDTLQYMPVKSLTVSNHACPPLEAPAEHRVTAIMRGSLTITQAAFVSAQHMDPQQRPTTCHCWVYCCCSGHKPPQLPALTCSASPFSNEKWLSAHNTPGCEGSASYARCSSCSPELRPCRALNQYSLVDSASSGSRCI